MTTGRSVQCVITCGFNATTRYNREVLQWPSENYPGRWIGRGHEAPISWPTRSPVFNPLSSAALLCHQVFIILEDVKSSNYEAALQSVVVEAGYRLDPLPYAVNKYLRTLRLCP
jgi:hypothetical protein